LNFSLFFSQKILFHGPYNFYPSLPKVWPCVGGKKYSLFDVKKGYFLALFVEKAQNGRIYVFVRAEILGPARGNEKEGGKKAEKGAFFAKPQKRKISTRLRAAFFRFLPKPTILVRK
jgi:hypothetical protein